MKHSKEKSLKRGDTTLVVMLLGSILIITIFSAAMYLSERTYAHSWSRSAVRTVAVSTALRCENYDFLPSQSCIYTSPTFIAETEACDSIGVSAGSVSAWRCEWDLAYQKTPQYIQEILLLYTSSRVEPVSLQIEVRGSINQVYAALKVCARASFPPIGRWCGESEAYRYLP